MYLLISPLPSVGMRLTVVVDLVDMSLSEDYRVNRLTEALDLFEEISTSEYFSETGNPR